MDNYLLEQVWELNAERVQDKTWLVVHKLHRTPYHIGLLHDGQYYSLSVSGMETCPGEEMVERLLDKTYNNLLVEMTIKEKVSSEKLKEIFGAGGLDHQQFRSCLFPVREFLALVTANNQYLQANNLFELLDLLKKNNLAGEKMATRMTPPMESKIVLIRYNQETIQKHIKRLQELNEREAKNR